MCGPASRSPSPSTPIRTLNGTARSRASARRPAQEFSLLPAQNTSGNWVKVVQRIPMRVRVDTSEQEQPPLRAGMSVEVDVDTGHARGLPHFLAALFGQATRCLMAGGAAQPAAATAAGITVCVILATIMQALDTTIANVALPYMQGSVSASQDQINWVLTSYIVAGRDHDAAHRLSRRPVRRQAAVLVCGRGLHRRLDAVRHGADR